ncbi:protein kinase domain-containing protein [Porcipelethomonas sp.]|uniref:protein kinase domain-containing protein n=1 Tax=Porcipelethomonas sp. TaxID=2981675 RepID=UPI003EF4DD94
MAENKLCMGCMENKGAAKVCPYCGYVENTPYLPSYIAPGTMLHDRYLVGQMLSANGQGASYIAYDTAVSCKVLLNEYMPDGLCMRVKGKPTISVSYNNLAQYKALMAEYTELNKSLAKMRSLSSHLTPTLDLFAENNTTYAVYEYIEGVRLVDYLKENAGELSWSEVSAMFPPLFTTLSLVHNAGVLHRGISPETIFVTDKGELKLTDFCISGVRTINTELKTEIFPGYAAPEQYSAASRQGTWTDVYGICAVLYRILTGSKPDPANIRLENDNLYTPQELNPNIPKHVSDVIMEGMNLSGDDRITTITELVTRLFDQPTSGIGQTQTLTISRNGIVENDPAYVNNQYDDYDDGYYDDEYDDYDDYDDDGELEGGDDENVSTFDKIKIPVIIGALLLAIILVIVVILFRLFAGGEDSNIRETSSVADSSSITDNIVEMTEEETTQPPTEAENQMPSLVGRNYDEFKDQIEEKYDITLEPEYEYNSDYDKNIIFWQELKIGERVEKGMTVKVKVSKGSKKAVVPEYENWKLEDYIAMLDELGIDYTEVSEINFDIENGYVTRVSPEPGKEIDLQSDDILTVYYADNPEETTAEPTEPPTEAPTEAPPVEEAPAETEAPAEEVPAAETEAPVDVD